jgi:hypothetical protein
VSDPEDPPPTAERLDALVAAAILLMSSYVREGGSVPAAAVVRRHLEAIAEHRDAAGVLGATCDQAADLWAAAPPPPRPSAPPGGARRGWLRLVVG